MMLILPSFAPAMGLLSIILLIGIHCLQPVKGIFIDDDRVRSLDIAPALGRGYSVKTNAFHSICLEVTEAEHTTVPSFNYDYSYTDISGSLQSDSTVKISASAKKSFGWAPVRARMEADVASSINSSFHTVMTTMRIERYYSSVKENKSPLSDDAVTLLQKSDYVGFYKACGPNYVRAIRRAQEVTAMFTFTSTDASVTASMKTRIKAAAYGQKFSARSDSTTNINTSLQTLKIDIMGYGLGLDSEGSDTLVATSLEDFNNAMKFAYTVMTRGNNGSAQTGMVYGIEVVPWSDNLSFQVNSNLHSIGSEGVLWTVPHEQIPNAFPDDSDDDTMKCGNPKHGIDTNDKCCHTSQQRVLTPTSSSTLSTTVYVCEPKRAYPVDLLKLNLQKNGEHVAAMEAALRKKMFDIMTLERCIDVLRALPPSEDRTYLETPDSVLVENRFDSVMTVAELRKYLDPDGKMTSVALLNWELDEWVDMYYTPCLSALFGMNVDVSGNEEPGDMPNYFMMEPFNQHSQCAHLSCTNPTNRWNRVTDGCTPSLAQDWGDWETEQPAGFTDDNGSCAKKQKGKTLQCSRAATTWVSKIKAVNSCWKNTTPLSRIDMYCTPRLSTREKDKGAGSMLPPGCEPPTSTSGASSYDVNSGYPHK